MEICCAITLEPPADEAIIAQLRTIIKQQEKEIWLLKEKIDYLLRKRFTASSERFDDRQGSLFEDLPIPMDAVNEAEAEPKTESIPQARKKGGRRRPPAHLPRVRIEHERPEDQRHCACGADLVPIGEEISEQYDVIPPVFQVLQPVRIKYACPCCDQGLKTAPVPLAPLPKHQVSPGMLAWIGAGKFVDGRPLYRQAAILEQRFGVPFNRTTLADWMIKAHEGRLKPLITALRPYFLSGDSIQADETTLKVLEEEGRQPGQKSSIWLRATASGVPVVLMDDYPSRGGAVADILLAGFKGYLQTDG